MDRDTTQPQSPVEPVQPEQAQAPAPTVEQIPSASQPPLAPGQVPVAQTQPQASRFPEQSAPPAGAVPPQPQFTEPIASAAQVQPISPQPGSYSIDARMTPVEIEGADDLIGAMHRHEKASSVVVIIAVVLLSVLWLGLAYHVHSVRSSNKAAYEQKTKELSPEFKAKKAEENFGPQIVDRPDGSLDVSKQVDNLYLAKDQDLRAKPGQQVNFYNGASFIVTDQQVDWMPASKDLIYQPKEGNKFVKLNAIVGNRAKDSNSLSFEYSVVQAGQEIRVNSKSFLPSGSFAPGVVDFSISSGPLNKGQTAKVGIVLEVPADIKELIITDRGGAFDKSRSYVNTTMKVRYTL